MMHMAVVYDRMLPSGEDHGLFTFSVVTREAPPYFANVHDRIPVILDSEEEIAAWLDHSIDSSTAVRRLERKPAPEKGYLRWWLVDKHALGRDKLHSAQCLRPLNMDDTNNNSAKVELQMSKTAGQRAAANRKREKKFGKLLPGQQKLQQYFPTKRRSNSGSSSATNSSVNKVGEEEEEVVVVEPQQTAKHSKRE